MIYAYLRHARRLLRCFGFRVPSSGLAERTLNFELLNLETLRIRRPGIQVRTDVFRRGGPGCPPSGGRPSARRVVREFFSRS